MTDKKDGIKEIKSSWLGRSLSNYKAMHASTAKAKGKLKELQEASTLTEAKKIVFGYKKKNTK